MIKEIVALNSAVSRRLTAQSYLRRHGGGVNVSQLPAGVYLAVVTQNGEKMWSEKVVVVH